MTTEKIQSGYNIPLGNGKYAMIDLCDLYKIEGWAFCQSARRGRPGYAEGYAEYVNGKQRKCRLHKLILGEPPPGFEIAHKDGDCLNCHRSNLKFLTRKQNAQGPRAKGPNASSQYRGVSKAGKTRWVARIYVADNVVSLGIFDSEKGAAVAYDIAARKYYGEYAAPNFPL